MFALFLPYFVAVAFGISSENMNDNNNLAADPRGSGGAMSDRVPDDQTPTGQFTTAAEVKPILTLTQGSWIAVRNYNGQDFLYFTHLLAWRCGLWDVKYGLNGAAADQVLPIEMCHENTNSPNALTDIENFLPYIILPENSVETVTIQLTYDDGTTQSATFDRPAIQMP